MYVTEIATGTLNWIAEQFVLLLYNTGHIYVWGNDADYQSTTGPNLIDGQWHTIAVTYDGAGSLSLYIDHALIETVTVFSNERSISYDTVNDNNYLGTTDNHLWNYVGDLKNIAFYDYALTASQATATDSPTVAPSSSPTVAPSSEPTAAPSSSSTAAPSSGRTAAPSSALAYVSE